MRTPAGIIGSPAGGPTLQEIVGSLVKRSASTVRPPIVADEGAGNIAADHVQRSASTVHAPALLGLATAAPALAQRSASTVHAPTVADTLQTILAPLAQRSASNVRSATLLGTASIAPALAAYSGATVHAPILLAALEVELLDAVADTGATSPGSAGSFTVSAGANRVLLYIPCEESAAMDVTAVSWGGQGLTEIIEVATGTGFPSRVRYWILLEAGIAAASGTGFSVSTTGTPGQYRAHAVSFQHVEQGAPVFDQDGIITDLPTGLDISTAPGGYVVAACMTGAASDFFWSGVTPANEIDASSSSSSVALLAGTTGSSVNVSLSTSTTAQNALAVIALQPLTGEAGDTIAPTLLQRSASSVHAPVLTPGEVAITPALAQRSASNVQPPTLLGLATVVPGLAQRSASAVHAPVLVGVSTLAPALVARTDSTVHAPTLAAAADVVKLDDWFVASTGVAIPGSHTPSAGSNRVLLYFASARNGVGETLTAVTYGGEPMDEVESAFSAGAGADCDGSLWLLDEAGIAAASGMSFGLTGLVAGNNQFRAFVAVFDLVDQTDPVLDSFVATAANGATPAASALTTDAGGYAIGAVCTSGDGDEGVVWGTMTQQIAEEASLSFQAIADDPTTGASVTPSITPTSFGNSVLIGLSLRKA